VVAEYFREGVDGIHRSGMMVDGGFAMGSNLPLFAYGEIDDGAETTVTTATGETAVCPRRPISAR
jgi:penicillin-binding protein 1A